MAIGNYNELRAAVASWLNRSDLGSTIPDLIALAESRIYRELRINAMRTAFAGTIAGGVLAVPSDFLEFERAHIVLGSSVQPLTVVTPDYILHTYPIRSADKVPVAIARDGDSFIFGPYPDSGYAVAGTYYKRLTALASASTNWFTANAPDVLLYASLVEAEPFIMNDERLILWEGKYQQAKAAIEREDRRGNTRGGIKNMTAA